MFFYSNKMFIKQKVGKQGVIQGCTGAEGSQFGGKGWATVGTVIGNSQDTASPESLPFYNSFGKLGHWDNIWGNNIETTYGEINIGTPYGEITLGQHMGK